MESVARKRGHLFPCLRVCVDVRPTILSFVLATDPFTGLVSLFDILSLFETYVSAYLYFLRVDVHFIRGDFKLFQGLSSVLFVDASESLLESLFGLFLHFLVVTEVTPRHALIEEHYVVGKKEVNGAVSVAVVMIVAFNVGGVDVPGLFSRRVGYWAHHS